jgi:uncharacterized protein
LLVAGVTTRALAVSAARAGFRVTAIDAFGDLDLRAAAEVVLARPAQPGHAYGPMEAAAAGSALRVDFAAYTSNFENYPEAVARLARGRRLMGNRPSTLLRVRDPIEVMRVLRRNGLAAPESRSLGERISRRGSWLLKPRKSGGGHGVAPWVPGARVPRDCYLQRRVPGVSGSISFAANGSRAVLLGLSRQLVGERAFGAGRFRYCGSILGTESVPLFSRQNELLNQAVRVAEVVSAEFGLVGLNGIDFIACRGVPYPVEVNPRYSASMELIERANPVSMFAIHAAACAGDLHPLSLSGPMLHGKAIVFARQDCVVSSSWSAPSWVADVPRPGEHIGKGRPICTVFARARSPAECRRRLIRRARMIYRVMKLPGRLAA